MSSFDINDPYDFFELSDNFTKKDLKRAYTKKIKQYKPEKFPEEFMQIRAAFERLEQELAYGKPPKKINLPNQTKIAENLNGKIAEILNLNEDQLKNLNIEIDLQEATDSSEEKRIDLPDLQETINEIQNPSFTDTYSHLNSQNYIEVSKEISQIDEPSFKEQILLLLLKEKDEGLETVIDGLIALYKKNSEDPIVEQTLRYMLREDLPIAIIESTLLQLASCLGGFYYNCELLLQKYLRELGFQKFEELLERCENRLSFAEKRDSPIFYWRLIYRYFFRIPENWRDEKIIHINEYISLDSDYLDEKLDFIDMLITFSKTLKDYPQEEQEIKNEFIQCIQTYQEVPGLQAEVCFYKLMKKIRQGDYLFHKLNAECYYVSPAFRLLKIISEEVSYERNLNDSEQDNSLTVYHFLQQLNAGKFDRVPQLMGALMFIKAISKLALFAALAIWLFYCCMSLFNSTGTYSEDATGLFVLVLFVVVPLLTIKPYRLLWPKAEKFFDRHSINMSHKQYTKLRRSLIDFLCENRVSEDELTKYINTYENSNIQCSYLQIGIGSDYAVSLAALASIHKF